MLLCNNDSCEYQNLCRKDNPCIKCNESYLCLTEPHRPYDDKRELHNIECPYLMIGQDNICLKLEANRDLITFDSIEEVFIYLQLRISDSVKVTIVNLSGINFWSYTNTLSELESRYRNHDPIVTEYLKWHDIKI